MAIKERYQYVVDLVTDGVQRGMKAAETATGAAETKFSKFKATASLAVAGVATGVATFAKSAVTDFTDSAIAAGKFADATGLSAEQASRWAEVAGDVGVEQSTIEGGFVRLEKAIGSNNPAIEELGIAMQYGADGTADLSATMLDAIKRLNGVQDPARRAELASRLFGRGFAEMAEIVMGDADDLKSALEGVSDAQVFDDEEVAKAREMRERLDEINDRFTAMKLSAGEFFIGFIDGAVRFKDELHEIGQDFRAIFDGGTRENRDITEAFEESERAAAGFDRALIRNATSAEDVRRIAAAYTDDLTAQNIIIAEWSKEQGAAAEAAEVAAEAIDLTDKALNRSTSSLSDNEIAALRVATSMSTMEKAQERAADMADRLERSLDAQKSKYQELRDEINGDRTWEELSTQLWNAAGGAEMATEDVQALKEKVLDYGEEVGKIPPEVATEILALIDQGKYDKALAMIAEFEKDRTAWINIKPRIIRTGASTAIRIDEFGNVSSIPAGDDGGIVPGPIGSPQLALLHGGETVLPTHKMPGSDLVNGVGGGVTANFYGITDEAAVRRALSRALQMARFT